LLYVLFSIIEFHLSFLYQKYFGQPQALLFML
jgi:hypothetical protein